jgi:hypothetical protein
VEPLLSDARVSRNFSNTLAKQTGAAMWEKLAEVCRIPVRRIIANNASEQEKEQVALCFVIQESESMPYMDSFLREKIVNSMIHLSQNPKK